MPDLLASSSNPLVKKITSLDKRKYREETGLFLVEGARSLEEALTSGWLIETCVYSSQAMAHSRIRPLLVRLQNLEQSTHSELRMVQVTEAVFAKLAATETPQGILATVKKKTSSLNDLLKSEKQPLLVVLDGIQDPGNAGAIVRIADAAGCTGVIVLKGCVDLFGAKAVRATMGSLFHLPIAEHIDPKEAISFLKQQNIRLFTTALSSSCEHYDLDYRQPLALVLGNEGSGVSEYLLKEAAERVRIPLLGKAESLNVAMAAAVLLYEAVRQRR